MANDYYDFNPSATTWVLMLSCMVLFVVALSLLLIYLVHRSGQATAPAKVAEDAPQTAETWRDAHSDAPEREAIRAGHVPAA